MKIRHSVILIAILLLILLLLRSGAIILAGLVIILLFFYPTLIRLVTQNLANMPHPEPETGKTSADRSMMSREEAMNILGLQGNPSRDEINEAYKRLMMKNHPDQGGTEYLAVKINLAKQILLDEK